MKSFALMVAGGVLVYALVSRKAPALFSALFGLTPPQGAGTVTDSASLADPPVRDSRPPPP